MFKKSITVLATCLSASVATANEVPTGVKIYDHTKTIRVNEPYEEVRCSPVEVPIYSNQKGDAGGGALAGMIIGGLLGKGVTGDDGGAAAGAVLGGIIGADKAQNGTNKIIGYKEVDQCETKTFNRITTREVYSHSTIRFYLDGKRYVVDFIK